MNCIDVRRQLLSEPAVVNEAIQAHLRECSVCAHFASGLVEFEHLLKQAAEVPVPNGLASRILLKQRLDGQRRQRHWQWLAVAASLFLAIGVLLHFSLGPSNLSLETSVLSHVQGELHHLQERNNVKITELNAVLRPQGLQIKSLHRQVHYAGACQMRQQQGAHLVIDSPTGPVTVLVMPGEYVSTRLPIKNDKFQGVILPISNGSMAIVGEDAEQLRQLEQELKAGIHTIG